jgi:hypothetical protein
MPNPWSEEEEEEDKCCHGNKHIYDQLAHEEFALKVDGVTTNLNRVPQEMDNTT